MAALIPLPGAGTILEVFLLKYTRVLYKMQLYFIVILKYYTRKIERTLHDTTQKEVNNSVVCISGAEGEGELVLGVYTNPELKE